jgi:hypothetical protein
MPNYYEILQINKTASMREIATAYHRRALILHPDKGGSAQLFQELVDAYNILKDPIQRRQYDNGTVVTNIIFSTDYDNANHEEPFEEYCARYKRENLQFSIPKNSERLDLYTYYNTLFHLTGSARIGPGISMNWTDWREIRNKLNYVDFVTKKISRQSRYIFTCCYYSKHRHLYDLALNYCPTVNDREIYNILGPDLIKKIIQDPEKYLRYAHAIFALKSTNLLTLERIDKIMYFNGSIDSSICKMHLASLLTANNFDFLMLYAPKSLFFDPIMIMGFSVDELYSNHLLTQENFECIVKVGGNRMAVASALVELKNLNILTPENREFVIKHASNESLGFCLFKLRRDYLFSPADAAIFRWEGTGDFKHINDHINKLFRHSFILFNKKDNYPNEKNYEAGKMTMFFALELKRDLKTFAELPTRIQQREQKAFKQQFLAKLHSKDHLISVHRAYWKILITNIAIAFTGIGLFAIGVNYVLNKQLFFAQTQREKLVNTILLDTMKIC